MTYFSNNAVVNDVTTEKKKYDKPEIEVFDLDNQSPLLVSSGEQSSGIGVGFKPIGQDDY